MALSVRWRKLLRTMKYVARARAARTQASTTVYHNVRRMRTELSIAARPPARFWFAGFAAVRKHVTGTATRVQQRFVRTGIDLATETIDINLDQIREGIELLIPNVLGNFGTAHNAAGIASEKFEESVFLRGHRDWLSRTRDILAAGVNDEIGEDNLLGLQSSCPAQQGPDARQEFLELERLGEVIIRAAVEPADAVLDGVSRGQHENGQALTGVAELLADGQAVGRRNHDVEDGEIVGVDGCVVERLAAGRDNVDSVGLLAQTFGDEPSDSGIIFRQQNAHVCMIMPFHREGMRAAFAAAGGGV